MIGVGVWYGDVYVLLVWLVFDLGELVWWIGGM